MLTLMLLFCSQIEINNIVGNEIDSLEAKMYHLFTDIENFVSAQFIESADSIIVHVEYMKNETAKDSTIAIDNEMLNSLNSYIRNFRLIIEDANVRKSFVETFKLGWPIVSQNDINSIMKSYTDDRTMKTACCVTGGCASGAYAAALITRDIRREIDTIDLPVPCFTGGDGIGCTFIPLPIERKIYRIKPAAYLAGAALGSGISYLWAKKQFRPVFFDVIGHDIVAFDYAGYPITEHDVTNANKGTNELLFGTLGLAVGLLGSATTAIGLLSPWSDMEPETDWHASAVYAPAILICGVEIFVITNFFIKKGRQLDRRATIERLKLRSTQ
jgi:hypothetical protein